MLLFLTVAVMGIAAVGYFRVRALLERIEQQDRRIALLTQRVWALEGGQKAPQPSQLIPEQEVAAAALPVIPEPSAPSTRPPAPPAAAPEPSTVAGEDWETRVGTNWLNRLGAAVLVIGFALFLGYSLTQLGPSGKILIGLAAGLSLLTGGIAMGGFAAYRNYSYSLMGAGWAVVFFTTYAAYGVPEARVLDSPVTGATALLVVTALMIAHSVYYQSETATALSCLLGFVGLNVSPLTEPGVLATLLLALSLTGLSYRFGWTRLPLLGVALTYLTFVLRYDASIYGRAGLLNGQATLWTYWLAFEAYDLMTLRRSSRNRTLFLLNACGFVGASILHEWNMKASDWSVFLALSALAYLLSSLLRTRLSESREEAGYEWAATASAALMAGALIERFSGAAITTALLLEGQMVAVIGMSIGSKWIQSVGGVILGLSCFRLIGIDAVAAGPARDWTPTGLLMSAVFFVDRWFVPRGWYLSAGAVAVAMTVVNAEVPDLWIAPVWAIGGGLAVALGRVELPYLGVAVLTVAVGRAAIENSDKDIFTTALVVAAVYSAQLCWNREPRSVRAILSSFGTALLTALIAERVQGRLLTVWLGVEGAALLGSGFVLNERAFRLAGLGLFLVCIGKLFLHDLRELDTLSRILSFLVLGVMMMAASWLYTRYREKLRKLL